MIEINEKQGTPGWHAARAKCYNASEAPAMMGDSSYMTRSQLLKQKATGIVPEIDAATQRRFDEGHRVEALARPLAESIIGEELYPIVATDDAGRLLASSDGATMLCNIGFEHKLWNAGIAAQVSAGEVPDSHKWQLDQQIAVFGFDKIMFVCSDGTPDNFVYCWYTTTPERIAKLYAGWDQFEKDLAAYVPEEAKPESATGKAPDALPALRIEVTGMVTASNLEQFKTAALSVFRGINTSLQTDQDFADAEKAVKFCKDAEEKLELAKDQALSQTESIDALFKTIDAIKDEARTVRLKLDKLVKAEKENRKGEIVTKVRAELVGHVEGLHKRIGFSCIPVDGGIFAQAIAGLKSLDSMRDKVSVALANAKVEANAIADRIEMNQKLMMSQSAIHLFPDWQSVCTKASDDFESLLTARIALRKEAEEKRLNEERERIRAEEQAKAEEKARREAQQSPAMAAAEAGLRAMCSKEPDDSQPAINETLVATDKQSLTAADHIPDATKMIDAGKTIKLGEIGARLGFNVTADFLESIGFPFFATDKNAKLYREASFPAICRAIAKHVTDIATGTVRLAA